MDDEASAARVGLGDEREDANRSWRDVARGLGHVRWCWVLGDDRVVGEQGLQLPIRLGRLGLPQSLTGVMLAARVSYVDEDLAAGNDANAAANVISAGNTKLTTLTLGANVWLARRLR